MAHSIKGIITSFKYEGKLPNIILGGNYYFLPANNSYENNDSDKPIAPYEEFTSEVRNGIKELSFLGKCAYVETEYFGGIGVQISETWENGKRIDGPLISYDGIENMNTEENVSVVESSINQTLKNLGVSRDEDKDEFDSIGLGRYRSNIKIFEAYDNLMNNSSE
jgi:hypothetical protein